MLLPNPSGGYWMNTDKPGGRVYFVGGGTTASKGKSGTGIAASDINDGQDPNRPLATISQGITLARAGAGDTICILPGNVATTAVTTISKTDITITGIDSGSPIPASSLTGTGSFDTLDVTAANVVIENMLFPASGSGITANINAGAAGLTVRNCVFECGANDVLTITAPAAGDDLLVESCRFYITADGPDSAVKVEAVGTERLIVRNCNFTGDNNTNKWDDGAIHSAVAHTACLIDNNTFYEGIAVEFTAAATGIISRNLLGEGFTLGDGIDPGSCMCFENYEADAVDETARLIPATAAS
jgi:hypothetical protein